MSYDVFAMCNPLYDIQAEIPEALLIEVGMTKGSMTLIDAEQQEALVSHVYSHIVNAEAGGSGANTAIGVALLGGTSCYAGKIGNDEHGTLYAEGLAAKNVKLVSAPGTGTTGISVILVTPDAERTMCTFLGICRELSPADVDLDALRTSKYLYVTGYLWDTDSQKAAVLHAMKEARAAGVKVALSLSDPFCVHRHRDELRKVVNEHVDLLFGNFEEAQAFTDTTTPHDAIRAMAPWCELAAITMDARGSLLRYHDDLVEIPSFPVTAVDATGAGDMYAAGLLYGLTHDLPLATTGKIASCAAAQVVANLGPRLSKIDMDAANKFASL